MSLKLSELVLITIKAKQSPPPEERLKQISYVITKVTGATRALRIQLQTRMNEYYKKLITQDEVINCLCILEYIVKNHPEFRPQICDLDFIVLLQSFIKKKGAIQTKLLNLIEEWAIEYPTEMNEIYVLYEKYKTEGILISQQKDKKLFDLPKKISDLTPSIQHCVRELEDALENPHLHNLPTLFESSTKLSSKLNEYLLKYQFDERYDQTQLQTVSKLCRKLDELIDELKLILNKKMDKEFDSKITHHNEKKQLDVYKEDEEDINDDDDEIHGINELDQLNEINKEMKQDYHINHANESSQKKKDKQSLQNLQLMINIHDTMMDKDNKNISSAFQPHTDRSSRLSPRSMSIKMSSPSQQQSSHSTRSKHPTLFRTASSSSLQACSPSSSLQLRPPPSRGTPIQRVRDSHNGLMSPINIYSKPKSSSRSGSYQSSQFEKVMSQTPRNERLSSQTPRTDRMLSQTPRGDRVDSAFSQLKVDSFDSTSSSYQDEMKYVPSSNCFESFDFDD